MRVLINALVTFGPRTGVGHYTAELLRCLGEQCAPQEQIAARPGSWIGGMRSLFHRAQRAPSQTTGVNPAARPGWKKRLLNWLKPLGRSLVRQYLRATAAVGRFDLYHEPNFIPAPAGIPTVATLHDLSVLLHPEWHPADRVCWFEKHFPRVTARCVHFFAISESARQELIHRLGIPPTRVTRTYMGVRSWLGSLSEEQVSPVLRDLGLPPRYVLYVGTIEPRKNVLTLLHAY